MISQYPPATQKSPFSVRHEAQREGPLKVVDKKGLRQIEPVVPFAAADFDDGRRNGRRGRAKREQREQGKHADVFRAAI